jgi:HEXXH motif-containing protein
MRDIYLRFAGPNPGPGGDLLGLIASEVGRESIDRAILSGRPALQATCPGLADTLASWCENASEAKWHPRMGQIRAMAQSQRPEVPLHWLAELGIWAALDGALGQWSFDLAGPTKLWAGRWVLPECDSGSVCSAASGISIRLTRSGSAIDIELDRRAPFHASDTSGQIFAMPTEEIAPQKFTCVLPGEMAGPELLPGYPGAGFLPGAVSRGFADSLHKTVELIARHAPIYLTWVADVIRFIVPVSTDGDIIGSSSVPSLTGLISVANDARPLAIAELLVHEASHQHFFVASCLGELTSAGDEALFYSRFSRKKRPLERILLAYHALANMALFYELCLRSGIRCEKRYAFVIEHMRDLEAVLRSESDKLTELGGSIWGKLVEDTMHLNATSINRDTERKAEQSTLAEVDRLMALNSGSASSDQPRRH